VKHFWVVGQISNNQISSNTSELLGALDELAVDQLAEVAIVFVGSGLRMQAPAFGRLGQPMTILIESEFIKNRNSDLVGREIADLAMSRKPELIVAPHNKWGLEVSAKISAKTRKPLLTNIVDIKSREDGFLLDRFSSGGQIKSKVWSPHGSVVTIHQGVFNAPKSADITTTVEMFESATMLSEIVRKLDHIEPGDQEGPSIADSQVIVSCGRGLQSKENLVLGKRLANKLGAAFGASRAIVDAGWIDPTHQVGLTGKVVSPRLYIACGISGADQHLAGMRQSDTVVAINRDPDAPIFKIADFGVVGDCLEILPALIEYL